MRSLVQVQDGPFGVGGLAQLVERLLCKQDVGGSNPSGSTTRRQLPNACDRLGTFVASGAFASIVL